MASCRKGTAYKGDMRLVTDGEHTYFQSGVLHRISNQEAFDAFHFKQSSVESITEDEIMEIIPGDDISVWKLEWPNHTYES